LNLSTIAGAVVILSSSSKTPVSLKLLAAFSLHGDHGKSITITSKKNQALLAILALSPNFRATRDRLAGILWGDRGDDQARDSLRQSIAVLRKDLGESAASILESTGDLIGLRSGAITIDVVEFFATTPDENLDSLRRAAMIYQGELLADLSLREAVFEDWLSAERRRMNSAAIRIFDQLSMLEIGFAQIDVAQRLFGLDPLREASHRRLMMSYANNGEKALALQQYDICKKILHDELNVEPAAETQELRLLIAEGEYHSTNTTATSIVSSQSPSTINSHAANVLPSLAVLPFQNIGGNPEQDYFADGIVEDIITALSRFKSFAVIARNSSFVYKGRNVDVRQVASDLDVRYIMNGSVRRSGAKLRIAAQLIDCQTGSNLWAENFDGEANEIFDFQDSITSAVAMLVEPKIQAAEIQRSKRERPGSMAVYDIYLKMLPKLTSDVDSESEEAFVLLQEALKLEPNNALLLAHAARVIDIRFSQGKDPIGPDDLKRCAEWTYRSLKYAAGDSTAMVYCGLALIQTLKDYDLGMAVLQTAVDNNPNSSMAVIRAGIGHLHCGSLDSALAYLHRAIQLAPGDEDACHSMTGIAHVQMILGNFREAIKWATRSLALNSQFDPTYWMLVAAHAQLGQMDEAERYFKAFQKLAPLVTIAKLRHGQPAMDPNRCAAIFEGLRLAGLPEA
jgi:TolB-like protein/DNA-binding SARP family transcriptional activator